VRFFQRRAFRTPLGTGGASNVADPAGAERDVLRHHGLVNGFHVRLPLNTAAPGTAPRLSRNGPPPRTAPWSSRARHMTSHPLRAFEHLQNVADGEAQGTGGGAPLTISTLTGLPVAGRVYAASAETMNRTEPS
jgi:hypothetical protein